MTSLTWMVPARRAVVREQMPMRALYEAWCGELQTHVAALQRWYPALDRDNALAAIELVDGWATGFYGEPALAAARSQPGTSAPAVTTTVDRPPYHFKPRLWKGPLRVLLETRAPDAPPLGETIHDPLETDSPPLRLNAQREIDNADAQLLMGDVVEMPLFKFLAAARLTEFGTKPRFDDRYRFHPDGSYLLGTSLSEDGSDDAAFHDNHLAMRTQLLLNLYLGAFYHDEPVYEGHADRAPIAPIRGSINSSAQNRAQAVLNRLQAEVRRVIELARRICPDELDKSRGDSSFEVSEDLDAELDEIASSDVAPPLDFLETIARRLRALGPGLTAESEALMDLHRRVLVRTQEWVLFLDELLASSDYAELARVGEDVRERSTELSRARSLSVRCVSDPCLSTHDTEAISILVEALVRKLRALLDHRIERVASKADGGGSAAPSAGSVYARGMMYAGTLYPGGSRGPSFADGNAWHSYTNAWGVDHEGGIPACLPTRRGLDGLRPRGASGQPLDLPVTPGSVCSDTTIWMSNYMVRNAGPDGSRSWGFNALSSTVRSKFAKPERDGRGRPKKTKHYPVSDFYEYVPWKEVETPTVSAEELERRLHPLLQRVRELELRVDGPTRFWHEHYTRAAAEDGWSSLGSRHREKLASTAKRSYPGQFLRALRAARYATQRATRSKNPKRAQAARTALPVIAELERAVAASIYALSEELEEAVASDDWKAFRREGKDFGDGDLGKYRPKLHTKRSRFSGRDTWVLGYGLTLVINGLRRKRRRLEYLAEREGRIEGRRGGMTDMTDQLPNITVVSMTGHEWAIVKLRRHESLAEGSDTSRAGFLAAYHPLSGAPFEIDHPSGQQLYIFEEGASLDRIKKDVSADGRKHVLFGARPFKWKKIERNEIETHFEKGRLVFGNGRTSALVSLSKMTAWEDVERLHEDGPFRPIFVHPTSRPLDSDARAAREIAYKRLVHNGDRMYAARAVPFATILETTGAYALSSEVGAHLRALGK